MGTDTEIFKAEKGIGVLIYRVGIALAMAVIVGLGKWNLSETHKTEVIVQGLDQHMKDSDQQIGQIGVGLSDLRKTVQDIKDREVEEMKDRESKLETRVSVIEAERREDKKP